MALSSAGRVGADLHRPQHHKARQGDLRAPISNPHAVQTLSGRAPSAPYYYSPSANVVYVTQAGAVLSGINFGSATVLIEANNVTVKDCTFSDTTGFWAINQYSGTGATIENCSFIGSKSPTEGNVWITSASNIMIEDNTFLNSP